MVTNQWHIFPDVIEKNVCDKIKDKTNEEWDVASTMDETWDEEEGWVVEEKPDLKSRISSIAWAEDDWLYDVIWPYMLEANEEAGWKYNIQNAEAMQITKYEKGGFYGFHTDGRGDHLSAWNTPDTPWIDGYVRKLSMTIPLNEDFEGGEFQSADIMFILRNAIQVAMEVKFAVDGTVNAGKIGVESFNSKNGTYEINEALPENVKKVIRKS